MAPKSYLQFVLLHDVTAIRMAVLATSLALTVLAQNRPAPARTEIADGIFLFRTAPYGDVGLDGNSPTRLRRSPLND